MFAGSLFSSAPWAHKHHNPKNVRSKKTKKDRKCWQKRPKKTENAGKKDQKRPKKTKKDTSKKTQKRHCHNTATHPTLRVCGTQEKGPTHPPNTYLVIKHVTSTLPFILFVVLWNKYKYIALPFRLRQRRGFCKKKSHFFAILS